MVSRATYPETAYPAETVATGPVRILYTLAELDQEARLRNSPSSAPIIGYLSVVLESVNLASLRADGTLYTATCPICLEVVREVSPIGKCLLCGTAVDLQLNANVVGKMYDETGSVAGDQLLFSSKAWKQLFGTSCDQIHHLSDERLGIVEDGLRWMRLALAFVWTPRGKRIAVARIMA